MANGFDFRPRIRVPSFRQEGLLDPLAGGLQAGFQGFERGQQQGLALRQLRQQRRLAQLGGKRSVSPLTPEELEEFNQLLLSQTGQIPQTPEQRDLERRKEEARIRFLEAQAERVGREPEPKPKTQRRPNQFAFLAATFADRAIQAQQAFEGLRQRGFKRESIQQSVRRFFTPEAALSEEDKLFNQAQRNFINATLRRESGAAISESEFTSGIAQYFPVAGDTPAVIQQKKKNREAVIRGFIREGAPVIEQFPEQFQSMSQFLTPKQLKIGEKEDEKIEREVRKNTLTLPSGRKFKITGK